MKRVLNEGSQLDKLQHLSQELTVSTPGDITLWAGWLKRDLKGEFSEEDVSSGNCFNENQEKVCPSPTKTPTRRKMGF